MNPSQMSAYERRAYAEIQDRLNQEKNTIQKVWGQITRPVAAVGDFAFETRSGEAVARAIEGIFSLISDAASYTVRREAIWKEYRNNGYEVFAPGDVFRLDLEEVDRVVGYLGAKYKSFAAGEGTATGAVGGPGIIADVPALLGMNLRGAAEYATYYGFDTTAEAERHFVIRVLSLASSHDRAAKQAALVELHRIAVGVAKKRPWTELEKSLIVKGLRQLAKLLGIRLTKAKLAQLLPVLGAFVGGGYNAYFTAKTTSCASDLYRKRFLAAKYGNAFLE